MCPSDEEKLKDILGWRLFRFREIEKYKNYNAWDKRDIDISLQKIISESYW